MWDRTVDSMPRVQPGQFRNPLRINGLALTPDDAFLLAVDWGNRRVVVLRATDGAWVRQLTGPPGTLQYPASVSVPLWCPRPGKSSSRTLVDIK